MTKVKKIIKNINFKIGGYSGWNETWIDINKNKVRIINNYSNATACEFFASDKAQKKFISEINKINFSKWQKEYKPKDFEICDGEQWELEVIFTDDTKIESYGNNAYPDEWEKFFDLINGVSNLLVEDTKLNKLIITLERNSKLKIHRTIQQNLGIKFAVFHNKESIEIDRNSGKMIISQKMSDDCYNKREYYNPEGIEEILNSIGCIEDKQETSKKKEEVQYTLVATYSDETVKEMKGNFNRLELPANWDCIVDSINEFVSFYSMGELLNKHNIPVKLAKDEVLYAEVRLSGTGGTYYYLVENLEVSIGDTVIVPVGSKNVEKEGYIENLTIYKVSEVPFPLNNIKKILKVDN